MLPSTAEVCVYFDALLRVGVGLCIIGVIRSADPLLMLWVVVMTALFWVQHTVPRSSHDAERIRTIFGASVVLQCLSVLLVAVITDIPGMWLIAGGQLLNAAVIVANDVRMPILNGWSENPCYCEADEYTRWWWLGDVFETTDCRWARWIVSPGDALEVIGMWALATHLLVVR